MKLKLPLAFEELLSRHQAEILRFLYRLTGDREDALDLFQETWLRAYRAYPEVDTNGNLRAWLFKIAANLHHNHVRGQKRRGRLLRAANNGIPARLALSTPPQRDSALMLSHLRSAIRKLPPMQREALVMRKFAGLEYAEIAAQLGCSDQSARAHVSQALRKLKAGWPL